MAIRTPKIKALRDDILRVDEIEIILARAHNLKHKFLVAMLFSFGKRVSETITLKRGDFRIYKNFITVRFNVLKRKPKSGIKPIFTKPLSRAHWLCPIIEEYLSMFDDPNSYLFPGRTGPGHINRVTAYRWLKRIDPNLWSHLFRHSLATLMAENGATVFELTSWFDWASINTALNYVQTTPTLGDKWGNRDF